METANVHHSLGRLSRLRDTIERLQWHARLRAWWDGYVFEPAGRQRRLPDLPAPKRSFEPLETPLDFSGPPTIMGWPPQRLAVVQALFGEGMIAPADPEALTKMTHPLGLSKEMTVVEVGVGLGGIARAISSQADIYITGFEPDAELARVANELSTKHGMARKVRITHLAHGGLDVRPETVDAVISKEALLAVEDKPAVFTAIRRALRPGGQLMMSEYMLVANELSPAVVRWTEATPTKLYPMPIKAARSELEHLGFQVRIVEDITVEYEVGALKAFADMAQHIRAGGPAEHMAPWVLAEGELWSHHLAALASGEVKVYRIYARIPRTVR